jgi:hypothetical protein
MSGSVKEAGRRYSAYLLVGILFFGVLGIATAIASYSLGTSLQGNLTDLLNGVANKNAIQIVWSILSAVVIAVIAMIAIMSYPHIKKMVHSHEGGEPPKLKFKFWASMGMGFLISLELYVFGLIVIATKTAAGVSPTQLWTALMSGQIYAILTLAIVVPIIAFTIIKTSPIAFKKVAEFEKSHHVPDVPDNV